MIRFALILILTAAPLAAAASTCGVSGTAYDFHGKPLRTATVRLLDTRTQQSVFRAADANAGFTFADVAADADYRLDVLSAPVKVTGTHLPTRSILGMSAIFACNAGQLTQRDVRVQVN